MAKFHFVEDYEEHVKSLLDAYPLDEAMALAVGGDFKRFGSIFLGLSVYAGLRNGMSVVDLGCGSGRAAKAFGENLNLEYLGIDVVQDLLSYAKSICPSHYRFLLSHSLSIPAPTASADMVVVFSVFTHLLHEETYLYLEDIHRVLKPNGVLVFSFLEFRMPAHWAVFRTNLEQKKDSVSSHLNMFIERNQIEIWAQHLGFQVQEFIDGDRGTPFSESLGQSVAILKPLGVNNIA